MKALIASFVLLAASVVRMGIPPTLVGVCVFVASVVVITPLAHSLIERAGISLRRRLVSKYFVENVVQDRHRQHA